MSERYRGRVPTFSSMDLARIRAFDPISVTDQPRDAGVLIPIVERADGDSLLFTKRSTDLGKHPGQMSFPGGGHEPEDEDIEATALREAHEEIGLDPSEVDVVTRIDDIRTITEYAVTPVVARIPDREYTPDEHEVAEVVVVAVDDLLCDGFVVVFERVQPAVEAFQDEVAQLLDVCAEFVEGGLVLVSWHTVTRTCR